MRKYRMESPQGVYAAEVPLAFLDWYSAGLGTKDAAGLSAIAGDQFGEVRGASALQRQHSHFRQIRS